MPILYDEKSSCFSLHTKHTTYQFMIDPKGVALHLYYGRRTEGSMSYLLQRADHGFSGSPYDAGNERDYSLDIQPQEYPQRGTGDYRRSAFVARFENGAAGTDLRYDSYSITRGKYALPSLPAVYAGEDEAETLELVLKDRDSELYVTLLYGVLPEQDIITRSVKVENRTEGRIILEKVLSANLDFTAGAKDVIGFHGRHAFERQPARHALVPGVYEIGSDRGASSHQHNPLLILTDPETNERAGSAWAMEFVYSGGFTAAAEMDQMGQTRMQMGLMTGEFAYPLDAGAVFYAPEVILSMSAQGTQTLSNQLARCLREHVARGWWKDKVRPTLLNSWEACYMNFDGTKILELADEAKALDIDLLVLDDGWFGKRDDDNSGLGDWFTNEEKLGGPLGQVSEEIHQKGLLFGLWVEPEMINEDSDLFRQHPDWALQIPGRKPVRGRNQLVLDYSRKEVVDTVFDMICRVLDETKADYLKWDYNRSIAEIFSTETVAGAVLYDYMLGLYSFLDRLNERYPKLLIEGCSGGGGRFDAGMLYYTPQIWCSDNTDAIDRLTIQYGGSFGYPSSMVGAHVSAVPNEQNGRMTPIKTRAVAAMFGAFGYELDPGKLSEEDKDAIRRQVSTRNTYAPIFLNGDYYRLSDPDNDAFCAFMSVLPDKSEAVLSVIMLKIYGNMTPLYARLDGLKSGAFYEMREIDPDSSARYVASHLPDGVYPADALMEAGFPLPVQMGEYQAYQWHLKLAE